MEKLNHENTIIEDASRIKEVLLPLQEQLNIKFTELQRETFADTFADAELLFGQETAPQELIDSLVDVRIKRKEPVISPLAVNKALPLTNKSAETTLRSRIFVERILKGQDNRLIVITGPCSLHDPEAVIEYAEFLKDMRDKYSEDLEIIMRLYSEKPRTELGWKGFIHDPLLNGSEDMNLGLIADRMTAIKITEMGVPLSRERLGSNTPQYVNGLITYDSIGARNAEDQNARMYVSGTSSHGGIKNSRDGEIDSAVSATISAVGEHSFIGMDENGQQAIVYTKGHEFAHIILRGGKDRPNFYPEDVANAISIIEKKQEKYNTSLPVAVMIDVSHGNKVNNSQVAAIESVAEQVSTGALAIKGILTESFIKEGRQDLDINHPELLEYGKSITDACESIDATEIHLDLLSRAVKQRRKFYQSI